MIRLDISKCKGFASHRSGWAYCINSLRPISSNSGIFLDDFVERAFAWGLSDYCRGMNTHGIPYKKPWIGIMHNPPNVPEWFDYFNSPQAMLENSMFQESMKYCRAFAVLSDYMRDWLQERLDVPVVSVKHPTETPIDKWNPEKFASQRRKKVVQLGYWLRRMKSIRELKCGADWDRIWLPSVRDYAFEIMKIEERIDQHFWMTKYEWSNLEVPEFISNNEYDELMTHCVVFLDLYDTSANNAVVESIARNTPVLVNKRPATIEYLGEDYPFYFDNLEEASVKINDIGLIIDTHRYLKQMDKRWIHGSFFAKDLHSKLTEVL